MTGPFSKLLRTIVVNSPSSRRLVTRLLVGVVTVATVLAGFAVPAYAGTLVTGVSFSGSSQVAHASSTWTVNFTPATKLTGGSTIYVTFPTNFTVPSSPTVVLGPEFTTENCSLSSATGSLQVVTITLTGGSCTAAISIALSLTIATITNGPAGAYTNAYSVYTSADTSPATATTAITAPGGSVTSVSFTATNTVAHTTSVNWTANFTTSSNGTLTAGDTVTITFPAGFTVPSGTVTVALGPNFAGCSGTITGTGSGQSVTVTLGSGCSLANSAAGAITVDGLTNPIAGAYTGAYTVATSENTSAVTATTAITAPGGSVTSVSFTATNTVAHTTSVNWTANFTTSSNGTLTAGDTVTITFPAGFTVPSGTVTVALGPNFAGCSGTITGTGSGQSVTVTLGSGCSLANSAAGAITVDGLTNPIAGAYTGAYTVATSENTSAVTATTAITAAGGSVTSVSFTATNTVAHTTSVNWTANFTTSSNGTLTAGDTVTITFPAGFTVPSGTVTVALGPNFAGCSGTITGTGSGQSVTVTLGSGCSLANSAAGAITVDGLTNPIAGAYTGAYSVVTLENTTATTATTAITAAGSGLTAANFTASSAVANTTSTTWTVHFTVSSAGQLAAGDVVTFTFPAGFVLPATSATGVVLGGSFASCGARRPTPSPARSSP